MSRRERVRELIGFEGSRQRYSDVESIRDLEEISDPETLEDETARTIREWLADHKYLAVSFGLLFAIGGLLLSAMFWQFFPLVIGNLYVQIGLLVSVGTLYGAKKGWQANQSRVEDIDELEVVFGTSKLQSFKGVWLPGSENQPSRFLAIKGYRRRGVTPKPYTIADIDPSAIERKGGAVDPDDPVIIRIQPEWEVHTETETGTRIVHLASGFDVSDGDWAVLKLEPPDLADRDKVRQVNTRYQDALEDLKEERSENKNLRAKVTKLRERVYEPIDERVEKEIERVERLHRGRRVSRSSRVDNGQATENGHRRTRGVDEKLEAVDEEVRIEDD